MARTMLSIFLAGLAIGMVLLVVLTTVELAWIIQDKITRAKIRKKLVANFEKNTPFSSEELMIEADKIANDEKESDNAREFAKRVYIIGRTAQAHQEEKNGK